ncbi:MAG TPA: hypothetical protein VIL30_11705 [Ramlibacter sp.]
MKKALVGLAALFCLVGLSHADASDDDAPMTETQYKAARQAIDTQLKAARQKCGALKGEREDTCVLQAKGQSRVARARLEAQREPTPDREQAAKEAEAEADFALAKAGCRQAGDKARKACIAQAQAKREAAVRQAKVEKVLALRREGAEPRKEATDAEKFAAAKARCDMSGAERDRCLVEARRRFNKT